jgi:glyoxylase-like metal-dependent hydrolase (beta-lactamase superfamily II)
MRELQPGLWHWEAPHPQWRPSEPWGPEVSSYAIDDGEWLLLFDPLAVPRKEGIGEAHLYAAGDRLDVGVEAFPGHKPNDTVLWIESHRTVIAGDTLVDFGRGLEINPRWLGPDVTREQVVEGSRPLLDLAVEHMLATHGGPVDRGALERALS